MSGQRSCFGGKPFHQIAVGAKDIGTIVEKFAVDLLFEKPPAHGHADPNRDSLAEGTGRGFNAGSVAEFRMTGSAAAELAEIFKIIQ